MKTIDHKQNYLAFDVRAQYKKIKENHPYHQELHGTQQHSIKYSYL